jgi:hypothetical protein
MFAAVYIQTEKAMVAVRADIIGRQSILISSDNLFAARRTFNLHERIDNVIITTATVASILTGRPNFDMPGKFQDRMDGKPHREE